MDAFSFITRSGKVMHYNADSTTVGTNLPHLQEQSTEEMSVRHVISALVNKSLQYDERSCDII